jgi:hypothetical protein
MELEAEGAPHDGAPFFFLGDKTPIFRDFLGDPAWRIFLKFCPQESAAALWDWWPVLSIR